MEKEHSFSNNYESCNEDEESTQGYDLRDRNKLKKPSTYKDFELSYVSVAEEDEPQTYDEAMASRESKQWKRATED